MSRSGKPDAASALRRALLQIPQPSSLFSGLTLEEALAPDNIIFFKRTDTTAFRPEGVADNYHHRFELVTLLRKEGPVRIGNSSYLLVPGESALIFPNQFHHYLDVETGAVEWLFITFELGNTAAIEALQNSPRILGAEEMQLLGSIVETFLNPACDGPDTVEISCQLARLLRRMTALPGIPAERCQLNASHSSRDQLLEKINQYVRSHLAEAPGIESLAKTLGYSVSHLRAIFRDDLGISLGRYWRDSRLSKAAELLQTGEISATDIAQQTGFESLFSFSRAFKRTYGIPPKEYSRRFRQSSAK